MLFFYSKECFILNRFASCSKVNYILITVKINCDRACENRACGHMIFAYFFKLPSHTTFYTINLLQCNFQVIVSIYFAL